MRVERMGMHEDSDTTGEFLVKFRGNFFYLFNFSRLFVMYYPRRSSDPRRGLL